MTAPRRRRESITLAMPQNGSVLSIVRNPDPSLTESRKHTFRIDDQPNEYRGCGIAPLDGLDVLGLASRQFAAASPHELMWGDLQ